MKKILITLVAMAFIALGFGPGAFATGMDKSMSSDSRDIIDWIGKDVRNSQGEDLGDVNGFVRDENGEISLVFVFHDEKSVAVPYSALSFNESEDHVVLDVTKDQLANAPEIGSDENLADRTMAEEVYRYFGERPAWTEKGGAADLGMKADEEMDTYGYYGTEDFGISRDDALEHIGPDVTIE